MTDQTFSDGSLAAVNAADDFGRLWPTRTAFCGTQASCLAADDADRPPEASTSPRADHPDARHANVTPDSNPSDATRRLDELCTLGEVRSDCAQPAKRGVHSAPHGRACAR